MRKVLSVCAFVTVLLLAVSVTAADKVVVIPLNSAKKLDNIVTVSSKGGDFTDPVAAVNSITDAAADNPYLVVIGPGVYTVTEPLIMQPYVSVSGAGQGATILTGSRGSDTYDAASTIVSGSDNTTLSDLTIENIGSGNKYSMAIFNYDTSPVIQNVSVTVTKTYAASNYGYGVRNLIDASPTMTNMTITVTGASTNYGVYNGDVSLNNSKPIMTNLTITVAGGDATRGVYNSGASPTMTNMAITVSDGSVSNYGVRNLSSEAKAVMSNMTVTASGGAINYGIYVRNLSILTEVTATASGGSGENFGMYIGTNGRPTIRHCTLDGTTGGVYFSGDTARVIQSSIIGGVTNSGSGTLTCVNSDNGVDTGLNSSCGVFLAIP